MGFGATNPEGIYVIDCQGGMIRVQYSRIVGTLVLLNPDSVSDIEDNVSQRTIHPPEVENVAEVAQSVDATSIEEAKDYD